MPHLKFVNVEKFSKGYPPKKGCIPTLKNNQHCVVERIFVSGDAPKEIIRVYKYTKGVKKRIKNWPIYIAKTGHKWYPYESITEFLLNKLGECLGLEMAPSRLVYAGGQIRFLSRYFLTDNQRLIHGADIFSGYLEDREFVEEIEKNKMARDMLSVQFVRDSLKMFFPDHAEIILRKFVQLLIFDAIVGNNDRHFYNWGVIRDIFKKQEPRFSPIYDTARGLFWNENEEKIISLYINTQHRKSFLEKYVGNCKPKIGWEGRQNLNHFQLVSLIVENKFGISIDDVQALVSKENERKCLSYISDNCKGLFGRERESLIKDCLSLRFKILRQTVDI